MLYLSRVSCQSYADVLLLSSEWELAAPMYLSTQCSSSLIGLR